MKIKLPKIKISQSILSITNLYGIVIILVISISLSLGWFLYKNFYQTIAQTEQIVLLRREVAPDVINIDKVNIVLENLNNKINATSTIDWSTVKNPFTPFETENQSPLPPPPPQNEEPELKTQE